MVSRKSVNKAENLRRGTPDGDVNLRPVTEDPDIQVSQNQRRYEAKQPACEWAMI